MSARKDRQIKAAMSPLVEEVRKYVENNKAETLGFVGDVRLKVKAHYDKVKKETQLILTFVGKEAEKQIARVKAGNEGTQES